MAGTDKNLFSILFSSSDNQWHRTMEKEHKGEEFNGTLGNSYSCWKIYGTFLSLMLLRNEKQQQNHVAS